MLWAFVKQLGSEFPGDVKLGLLYLCYAPIEFVVNSMVPACTPSRGGPTQRSALPAA